MAVKWIRDKGGRSDETQSTYYSEGLSQFYLVWDHRDVVEGPVVSLLQGNSGEENFAVSWEDRLLVLVAGSNVEEIPARRG